MGCLLLTAAPDRDLWSSPRRFGHSRNGGSVPVHGLPKYLRWTFDRTPLYLWVQVLKPSQRVRGLLIQVTPLQRV